MFGPKTVTTPKKGKHSVEIISHTSCNNGWFGAGIVKGAANPIDVIGFRIIRNDNDSYWMDLSISEALDLAVHLTLTANRYLIRTGKYIKNI